VGGHQFSRQRTVFLLEFEAELHFPAISVNGADPLAGKIRGPGGGNGRDAQGSGRNHRSKAESHGRRVQTGGGVTGDHV
jgi:hypothetical protein